MTIATKKITRATPPARSRRVIMISTPLDTRPCIAVARGGTSPEREISLVTGAAVADALRSTGRYHVYDVDLREDSARALLDIQPDAVYVALHGPYGEEGRLQAELDAAGVPYTGSGPRASRLALDKLLSKLVFDRAGVSTPPFAVLEPERVEVVIDAFAMRYGYPMVVKPVAQGSSLGITVARTRDEAIEGAGRALSYDQRALVEAYVDGNEVTVTIIDGELFPVVEIEPATPGFYDYASKYQGGTRYCVSPDLPPGERAAIEKAASTAYLALGCEGLARVDLIRSWIHGPQVLEANTVPGFTPTSLAPMACRARGVSFVDLCDRLISSALNKGGRAVRVA